MAKIKIKIIWKTFNLSLYAVTGTKDAVDKEGKPIYQQVDVSSLIPIMVKAIQELKSEIDILKQEIINLKNK